MPKITLRFYAELNDFLAPAQRQRDLTLDCPGPAPARHLIELCGVPHTEVELIVRDGESIGLETPVAPGERIGVYPMFEAFDVRPVLRTAVGPKRVPRFLADAHLGTLAKRLRMLGFDTLWHNDLGDSALAALAANERRILLSSDRRLLMHKKVTHGCYVRQAPPDVQLAYLVERLQLCAEIAPFTRCTVCNGHLSGASLDFVCGAVPPRIRESQRDYWRCDGCGRVYWKGSHWARMRQRIEGLCGDSALLD